MAACGYVGFLVEPALIGALATRIGLHWAMASAIVVALSLFALAPALRVSESRVTSR